MMRAVLSKIVLRAAASCARDGQNLLNIADTLAAKIPGARKVTIPGASHHPRPARLPA